MLGSAEKRVKSGESRESQRFKREAGLFGEILRAANYAARRMTNFCSSRANQEENEDWRTDEL